ncbi:hypothetical protein BH09BAC1_BH09BAC1_16570 [soil metagenome]
MSALKHFSTGLKTLLFCLALLIGASIFVKSLDYYRPDFNNGYLSDKRAVFNGIFAVALYAHIIIAPVALLIATVQSVFPYWKAKPIVHRWLGTAYVLLVITLGAPSGFVMAFYSLGGWMGHLGFLLLSLLWVGFTLRGWQQARKGEYTQHRKYMLRSYVLVLSAVSLRLLLFISNHYFNWAGDDSYAIIAWLSWLPQLFLLEIWLKVRGNVLYSYPNNQRAAK